MKTIKTWVENCANRLKPSVDQNDEATLHQPSFENFEQRLMLSATIASQDFNSLSDSGGFTMDSFLLISVDDQLTNSGSKNENPANGMTFKSYWSSTRGATGPVTERNDNGMDFIGVTSLSGTGLASVSPTNTPITSGVEHNFLFNDSDGQVGLVFDPIDLSTYENINLSFNYWIAPGDNGYEAEDTFEVFITDTSTLGQDPYDPPVTPAFSISGDALTQKVTTPTTWNQLSLNLSNIISDGNLSADEIYIRIDVDHDAGNENIQLDNILITGDLKAASTDIDFETDASGNQLSSGDIISDQWAADGITIDSDLTAMLFDTSSPTGGDDDLATTDQGLVMILSEDGDTTDPDDNATGGTFTFTFDEATTVNHLGLLDIDECETVIVTVFDETGSQTGQKTINGVGDNKLQIVALDFESVNEMTITLSGSGAITRFNFEDTNTITGTNDSETITGNNGDNTLNGEGGVDTLQGRRGNDTINGGEGSDIIRGGAGDDALDGGLGSDWIRAGTGNDSMTGGQDSDYFIFGNNLLKENQNDTTPEDGFNNTTVIEDFQVGLEHIVIQNKLIKNHTNAGITNSVSDFGFDDLLQLATESDVTGDGQTDVILTFMSEFGVNRIIISGVTLADLTENDFIFGGQTSATKFENDEGVFA